MQYSSIHILIDSILSMQHTRARSYMCFLGRRKLCLPRKYKCGTAEKSIALLLSGRATICILMARCIITLCLFSIHVYYAYAHIRETWLCHILIHLYVRALVVANKQNPNFFETTPPFLYAN
jgi:hypothetical protein